MVEIILAVAIIIGSITLVYTYINLMNDYKNAYISMLSVMDDQDKKIAEMERIVSNINNYVQTFKDTPVKGKHAK